MATSELLVGALTATTALAASYLTARSTSRAALLQARTTAASDAIRGQRERRRSTYREMLACAHAFSAATWRMVDLDATPDPDEKDRLLDSIREQVGSAVNDLTRATREVLLDGPAEVSAAAETVRKCARRLQDILRTLEGAAGSDQRRLYDDSYRAFRDAYVSFIDLARHTLEVDDA